MESPEDLLDLVKDRASFLAFAKALAAEREKSERMEADNPVRFQLGGALNWQNSSISTFLSSAIAGLEGNAAEEEATWQQFAEFLYLGKIYE